MASFSNNIHTLGIQRPGPRDHLTESQVRDHVKSLVQLEISQIGSVPWFEQCVKLDRLHEQSMQESMKLRPKLLGKIILQNEKMPLLIHIAMSCQIWRLQVLPKLLTVSPSSSLSPPRYCPIKFIPYMTCYSILFQEPVVAQILSNILTSESAVRNLGDYALDVIDYCVALSNSENIKQVPGEIPPFNYLNGCLEDIDLKQTEYVLGLSGLITLSAFGVYTFQLNESALVRLYIAHDVPLLLANALLSHPWKYECPEGWMVYDDLTGQWKPETEMGDLVRLESSLWVGLTLLLTFPLVDEYYEFTPARRSVFLKLRPLVVGRVPIDNEVIDGLNELLDELENTEYIRTYRPPVIVSTEAPITKALRSNVKQWKNLTEAHKKLIYNQKHFMDIVPMALELCAKRKLQEPGRTPGGVEQTCKKCEAKDLPLMKCSQCKATWYCSKSCQKKDWPDHKLQCTKKK